MGTFLGLVGLGRGSRVDLAVVLHDQIDGIASAP